MNDIVGGLISVPNELLALFIIVLGIAASLPASLIGSSISALSLPLTGPYITKSPILINSQAIKIQSIASAFAQQPLIPEEELTLTPSKANNFLSYHNSTLGIKILYPYYWEKQNDLNSLRFLSPKFISETNSNVSQEQRFRPSLTIISQNLSALVSNNNITLDNYVNGTISSSQQTTPGLQILDSRSIDIIRDESNSTIPAHKAILTWSNPEVDENLKWMEFYTIAGDKAYIITYGAPQDKYDAYLPTIKKMIGSLQIVR